jgi:hypothetical protein
MAARVADATVRTTTLSTMLPLTFTREWKVHW